MPMFTGMFSLQITYVTSRDARSNPTHRCAQTAEMLKYVFMRAHRRETKLREARNPRRAGQEMREKWRRHISLCPYQKVESGGRYTSQVFR